MPGPAKLPSNVLQITGRSDGVDSGGRPIKQGPSFARLAPEKPADLSSEAAFLWDKILPELSRLDLLREVDQAALTHVCETWSRWREAVKLRHENGVLTRNRLGEFVQGPWVKVEETASTQFRMWAREYGLTASAEGLLQAGQTPEGGEDDPFEW